MYEHRRQPLISRSAFHWRLAGHGLISLAVIGVSLLMGILGYHLLGHLNWIDSLLNAAMILGGEGPVDRMETSFAKLFASLYALYSGLILLVAVGIILAPALHRLLHSFHIEAD
jgi:hypothetical protein